MQHWNEATRASYWARFKHTVRSRFVFFVSRTLLLKPEESLFFFFPFRFSLVLNGQPRGSPANTLPARNFHGSPLVRPLSTLFHGAVGEKGQDGQGFVGGFGKHGAGGKEGGWKREIGAGAAANNTPPARVGKPALSGRALAGVSHPSKRLHLARGSTCSAEIECNGGLFCCKRK